MTNAIAAIDIGTNSLHLMVAEIVEGGGFRVLTREKDSVRLGSGASDMKYLSDEAMDRGIASLRRFVDIASQWDAPISAFATSAVREATNQATFIRRAQAEANVHVDVISGPEEARLIHLGVMQGVALANTTHLVLDIGGGSTEFIVGYDTTPLMLRSLKLGAIRLTDRFFPGGLDRPRASKHCRAHIASYLAGVRTEVLAHELSIAVASSGTAETLAILAGNPERLKASDLAAITKLLLSETPAERMRRPGIDERRCDIISGGAVLLDEISSQLKIQEWTISPVALRAGIVLDALARRGDVASFHHLSDLRRQSALAVARRYHEDLGHAEHITDLALELFDELSSLHGMGVGERDLLEAAGLLHNIGVFVAHGSHHKHSYYLIRNDEQLAGFTDRERELTAQIARYHRKSAPKLKHPEYAVLDDSDQAVVQRLAAILRIAIGLDRSGRQVVRSVRASIGSDIVVTAAVAAGEDASLEIHAASARVDLLASITNRCVRVETEIADPTGTESIV